MAIKISNEVKIGIVGLITLAAIVYGMNYLKGTSLFKNPFKLHTGYDDINGLAKGGLVFVNGYQAGKVSNLVFDPKTHKISVEMVINEEMNIPDDSKAVIFSPDLMGGKAIRIDLGKSSTFLQDEANIQGTVSGGMMNEVMTKIDPLKMEVEALAKQLNAVVGWTNYTLDSMHAENKIHSILDNGKAASAEAMIAMKQIDVVIANVNKVVESIEKFTKSANSIVGNIDNQENTINGVMKDVKSTSSNIKEVTDSVALLTAQLRGSLNEAKSTLENVRKISEKIDRGEGSIGVLLNDKKIANDINALSAQLDSIVKDVKARPRRYIPNIYLIERKKKANE